MVFQDGAGAKDYVPVVFDNLIAKRDMPVTVGVFIQPGVFADSKSNRSFEYDTLSDQYARFLLDEAKADRIEEVIAQTWPETLEPHQLGDERLARQVREARAALLEALDLGELA